MPKTPSDWNMKHISAWWQKGIDKERARLTNAPKPGFKKDRLAVREDFSNFAPPLKPMKKAKSR